MLKKEARYFACTAVSQVEGKFKGQLQLRRVKINKQWLVSVKCVNHQLQLILMYGYSSGQLKLTAARENDTTG